MLEEYFKKILSKNRVLNIVGIEITNACNMRCIHCYQDDRSDQHEFTYLPLEQIKNVVDQLSEMKTLRISLTGGEVFCHPDILEIIDYIHSKNISVGILSNITLITPKIIEKIKDKVHAIYTTIYGFDKETYEKVTRREGSFERYQKAKELIKDAGIYLEERAILLEQNSHQLSSMMNQCSNVELKVDVNPNNSYAEKCISNDACKRMYFSCNKEKIMPKDLDFDAQKMLETRVCNVCEDSFCITCEGNVIPCINLNFVIGNIYKEKLLNLWNSNKINEIREYAKIKYFSKCVSCSYAKFNRYWCLATNSYETGNMHIPSKHSCELCHCIKNTMEEN